MGMDGMWEGEHFVDEDLLCFGAQVAMGRGLDFVEVLDYGLEVVCGVKVRASFLKLRMKEAYFRRHPLAWEPLRFRDYRSGTL